MIDNILIVHNLYGSSAPSGENTVVELESKLLRQKGHGVEQFTRHSDNIRDAGLKGLAIAGFSNIWNFRTAAEVKKILSRSNVDIVHAHNTFPLISPSIFWAARGLASRVLTLHNYRLFCAGGLPFRDQKTCLNCIEGRSSFPALKHSCYRKSKLATAALSANISLHRSIGTWQNEVDAFIVFSDFQKDIVQKAGLPAEKIHIKPNFFPGKPVFRPYSSRKNCAVFVGRLSPEKGVEDLLEAWAAWGTSAPELRIIGDGPLTASVQQFILQHPFAPIKLIGRLEAQQVEEEISCAKLMIVPSICFEGFPLVIREAFALGTPVASSNVGPLPSIVGNGVSGINFEAANPISLLAQVSTLWKDQRLLSVLSQGALTAYQKLYNEEANYRKLMEIYDAAKSARR
jgi:glycosyltransferase involved in cell wall biosynthesis